MTTEDQDIAAKGLPSFSPYLMNRITHRYNQTIQKDVAKQGLTIPKMRVLAALAAMGELTVNRLTVYAVAEQSTMSRTLDQMENEGLIAREISTSDSRARVVTATQCGLLAYKKIWPTMKAAEDAMLEGIDVKDKEVLIEILNHVLKNIRLNPF